VDYDPAGLEDIVGILRFDQELAPGW